MAGSEEKKKKKFPYIPPQLFDLGVGVAHAATNCTGGNTASGNCEGGSTAFGDICKSGQSAILGTCDVGNVASSQPVCAAGNFPGGSGGGGSPTPSTSCSTGDTAYGLCRPGNTAITNMCRPGQLATQNCRPGQTAGGTCKPGNAPEPGGCDSGNQVY